MSWLDTIRGALVEEDPKPTGVVTAVPSSIPMVMPPPSTTSVSIGLPITAPSDPFLAKLRSKLSTPGSAVEKFETTFSSLSAITDAGVRLTSTLSVLKNTAGVETQAFLQEYSTRRQQLDQEVQNFSQAIAGQRKTEVDDKQGQITAVDAQIQQLSMQRTSLATAMTAAKTKLEQSQAGFDGAVTAVRGEIEGAIAKLKGANG